MTTTSKLPIAWYKGCKTKEEKEARETLVRNSFQFSSLLLSILSDRYEAVEERGLKESDYSETGWMFLQAFRNGRKAELSELAELFSFLKETK